MATFILVPGASHTAWSWHRIVALLEQAGHHAIAVDLPGTGENRSIHPRDATLAIWADHVADLVREAAPPVLLVGHSRGGHVIGEAAERLPDRLAGLIYVTAALSMPGSNLIQTIGYDATEMPPVDADGCVRTSSEADAARLIYHRCTPEDAAEAHRRRYDEPIAPDWTPASVTLDRWGRVPRGFVECSDDRMLTLACQRWMQAKAPCDPVITLDTDHSPFFSAPEALTVAMIEIARAFIQADATA